MEAFDIIIQAGQSNSEGYGYGDVKNPFEPSEKIWYLNSDFTISMAAEAVLGNFAAGSLSLPFAARYIKSGLLESGRKLLIIRAAVGGTGFSDGRWGLRDDLFLRMTDMTKTALELGGENRLAAFLWHQGETDAGNRASYETHFENLSKLINSVRSSFNSEKLPFIAGDFVHDWKMENISVCEPVIRAIMDVCAAAGSAAFVGTAGLLSNRQKIGIDDNIHFCREALYTLGEEYFKAFSAVAAER